MIHRTDESGERVRSVMSSLAQARISEEGRWQGETKDESAPASSMAK
jgi:hypothetical protein